MHFKEAAKAYLDLGWPVFPVREKDKRPAVAGGFKAASLDPLQVEQWAQINAGYNIGIPTGGASGFVVLEFDFGKGGEQSLEKLRAIYGAEFLSTYTVRSGSGGLHLYYRTPDWPFTNKAGLAGLSGVDTRGEGGYVVVPPSIHPNGNAYKIESDCNPAKCPEWLRGLMAGPQTVEPNKAVEGTASSGKGRLSRATTDFLGNGAPSGQWNVRLFKAAKDFQEQGYSEEEALERFKGITGHLDPADVKSIASAFKKAAKHPPRPAWQDDADDEAEKAFNLADQFLKDTGLTGRLKEWRGSFYIYTGTHYVKKSSEDMKTRLVRYAPGAKRSRIDDALLNLLAFSHIESDAVPPLWVEGAGQSGNYVAMGNGLIPYGALLDRQDLPILPHTADFFSFSALPYNYDPAATCPRWEAFLTDVLPDPEIRLLMQEWFGYCLTPDTSQERFMLLHGNGGDGKSVLCMVLRELLGRENCSAVSLEGFDTKRSYMLASTAGKLANIVEDVNQIEKAQEGLLKDFVSGGTIQVEEKYKDPFPMIATARATFSCNTLPRFTDRSGGLWRRLLLIRFPKSIPKDQQDPRLKAASYWKAELPGIFNWAVEGLRRLNAQGRFTEPASAIKAVEEYQQDMNGALQFLKEGYELSDLPDAFIPLADVYNRYRMWSASTGAPALAMRNFNKEVERIFSGKAFKHLKKVGGEVSRGWKGLIEKESIDITEEIASGAHGDLVDLAKRIGSKRLKG